MKQIVGLVALGAQKVEDRRIVLLGQRQEEFLIDKKEEFPVLDFFGDDLGSIPNGHGVFLDSFPKAIADALLIVQGFEDCYFTDGRALAIVWAYFLFTRAPCFKDEIITVTSGQGNNFNLTIQFYNK